MAEVCPDGEVPEGVEAEPSGLEVLGDRELRLAPVARRAGTPLIRVRLARRLTFRGVASSDF